MSMPSSALRTASRVGGVARRAITGMSEFVREAAMTMAICCTVAWAVHAAPVSMDLDRSSADVGYQPTLSAEVTHGTHRTVCESAAEVPADAGACEIDLFGASGLAPGATVTSTVKLTSTSSGAIPAVSLRPLSACVQTPVAPAPDLCRQVHLRIECGSRRIFDGTAADLGRRVDSPVALDPLPVHGTETLTTEVSLPRSLGNEYQGLGARLPILISASS